MASQEHHQLHFVLVPFMAQGHMIPMFDIGRLLAQQGMMVTIVTTPLNAARYQPALTRAIESGLQIRLIQLQFPTRKVGLPDGCENIDMLPSQELGLSFFNATEGLQQPLEELFQELTPRPNCIISDMCLPWTINVARKFHIPRISFIGTSCICLLCIHNMLISRVFEKITSPFEYFVVPDFPDRVEITKAQLPQNMTPVLTDLFEKTSAAERETYGVIMNTFEELEPAYAKGYKKARKDKVWCIGPVSLCNKDDLDMAQRGNKTTIDENQCLKWLDSWGPSTVLYACLGSLCNLTDEQLIELGLGLEASNRPFVWVVRGGVQSEPMEKLFKENGFEERTKERSLLIRGWAPQTLILSHPSVGGFLTHCGWNSILEGVCAGLPMITLPLFGDQFLNEKLIGQILNISVKVGGDDPITLREEEKNRVLVRKENVKNAIEELMNGEDSKGRKGRARELAEMAKRAVEKGGSSHLDIALLIQDILQQGNCIERS
ncbi:UDP-glycosyltransferase 73C6-like [Rosa rugosa]|uniref:UDP-glycosyltransferase 73C6-like n=1 Tax=Rosa rugosa TaxID=74645 RepID=UPI002B414EF0|nr:UDP-glycosyltransferase 73C6-like [Rosa rugosa]